MECFKCKKRATSIGLGHFPGKLCNGCFLKFIEKRVRKSVRLKKLFSRGNHVLVLDDRTKESLVSQNLLQSVLKHLNVTVFVFEVEDKFNLDEKKIRAIVKTGSIDKIVLPWSLDDEVEWFLEKMFKVFKLEKQK